MCRIKRFFIVHEFSSVRGNQCYWTIVAHNNGRIFTETGIASCKIAEDTFNKGFGLSLARSRANEKIMERIAMDRNADFKLAMKPDGQRKTKVRPTK